MTEKNADETTKEISSTIFFAPRFIIIGACLCSFFPGYGQTWAWVIGSYVLFKLTWLIVTPFDQSPWTVVYWNYAYIFGLLFTMMNLNMGNDIYNYYKFMNVYIKYENQYNNGVKSAALNIANLYKNTAKLPSAIQNEYHSWLKVYADDAIDQKNQNAIVEIKLIGKYMIRGSRGNSYTDDTKNKIGRTYYNAAYELGDTEALIEMEREIEEAALAKIDEEKRDMEYQKYWKKYWSSRPKSKSSAEKLGEFWGSVKKRVIEVIDPVIEDFNRGERRTN